VLWQYTDSIGPQRSIIPSMACTPIGVKPPHGVSSLVRAPGVRRQGERVGKVIVASTCSTVPRSPERIRCRSFVISGWKRRL
jgi:hypothetical protein